MNNNISETIAENIFRDFYKSKTFIEKSAIEKSAIHKSFGLKSKTNQKFKRLS